MRRLFRDMKIHSKMMISFLIVCLIPVITVGSVVYHMSARSLESASMEFASIFNSQIVSNLNDFIEEYDRITKSMLVDEQVLLNMNVENTSMLDRVNKQVYMRNVMMRMVTLRPDIKGISIVSPSGAFYQFSSGNNFMEPGVLMEQSWYQNILDSTDTLYITGAHDCSYYDQQQDRIVVTIARKIYDYTGVYAGMVMIDLPSASLVTLNDDFLLARNNYNISISITNDRNHILYDTDVNSGLATWEEVMEKAAFLEDKETNDNIIMSSETEQGHLSVHAIIPRSSLRVKIDRVLYVTFLSVSVCIYAVVVLSWYLSRSLSKPIRDLQKSMKQVELGNYQVMLTGEGKDEIGSLIASYNHMISKIKILIEDVYLAEIEQRNAQYLALQTQINPHMLYNTLETIRMNALMQGDDKTADMIKSLSRMFRMALDRKSSICRMEDEIVYVEAYMKLLDIRYEGKVFLEIEMPDKLRKASMLSHVFQPIVENSIEHGFRDRNSSLHMTIQGAFDTDGNIRILFTDDGCGMSEERRREVDRWILEAREKKPLLVEETGKRISIGLKNIAERIFLHYGEKGNLQIMSSDGTGTVIRITIPVETDVYGGGEDVSGIDCGR